MKLKPRHSDGTIGSLVLSFYQLSAFSNCSIIATALSTVLESLLRKMVNRLVRDMPRRVAVSIIEEMGENTPGMANLSASVLRRLVRLRHQERAAHRQPISGIEPYKLARITPGQRRRSPNTGRHGRLERESVLPSTCCFTPANALVTLSQCVAPINAMASSISGHRRPEPNWTFQYIPIRSNRSRPVPLKF